MISKIANLQSQLVSRLCQKRQYQGCDLFKSQRNTINMTKWLPALMEMSLCLILWRPLFNHQTICRLLFLPHHRLGNSQSTDSPPQLDIPRNSGSNFSVSVSYIKASPGRIGSPGGFLASRASTTFSISRPSSPTKSGFVQSAMRWKRENTLARQRNNSAINEHWLC